jgi:hypothetical protein
MASRVVPRAAILAKPSILPIACACLWGCRNACSIMSGTAARHIDPDILVKISLRNVHVPLLAVHAST